MKLKTLKDFLPPHGQGDKIVTFDNLLNHENLQKEAKKWLKADYVEELGYKFGVDYPEYMDKYIRRFIKRFFNLEKANNYNKN